MIYNGQRGSGGEPVVRWLPHCSHSVARVKSVWTL